MSDLISKSTVIELLHYNCDERCSSIVRDVEQLPTIDAEPVRHGQKGGKKMISLKENELYQEIELFAGGQKIGEAEVEIKGKMLSRLCIYEPYENKGFGAEVVNTLNVKYGCDVLWVNADNARAIHIYEKNGYKIEKPTMYLMRRGQAHGQKGE